MSAIVVEKLTYEYYSRGSIAPVRALEDVSFSVDRGEFVAIVGRNGSGKSTLARHMNGLLIPVRGTVCIHGKYTNAQELIWDIRRSLGMVFQNPDNQLVATTVEEDVAFGPENLGIEPGEICRRVDESLERVDMLTFKEHSPHLLSGGQKQRVAIAGVLAMHPQCLVLDEATSMLDPEGRRDVMEILRKLNQEEGITILLITHHMNEAAQAGRIIVMDQGRMVMEGTPVAVFRKKELLFRVGLDIPQISELYLSAVKEGIMEDGKLPVLIHEAEEVFSGVRFENRGERKKETASENGHQDGGEAMIETDRLSYTYMPDTPYERQALKDVSLTIFKGEILGIIGHTGSGKSTLIQHFNGLLTPSSGSIRVSGIVPEGKGLKQLRRKVGLIFQNPEDQLFEETVEKDILFGIKKMGLSETEIKARVEEVLMITGLSNDILEKSPFELSGGQKRRVAIAGVIIMNPEILVLDEPTAGLDPNGSHEIYQFLLKLQKEKNTTIVIVSHTMEDIARYCHRTAIMAHGKLVMTDKTRSVFSKKSFLEEIGLDVPQITELFHRLHQRDQSIRSDIMTVEEGLFELKRVKGV